MRGWYVVRLRIDGRDEREGEEQREREKKKKKERTSLTVRASDGKKAPGGAEGDGEKGKKKKKKFPRGSLRRKAIEKAQKKKKTPHPPRMPLRRNPSHVSFGDYGCVLPSRRFDASTPPLSVSSLAPCRGCSTRSRDSDDFHRSRTGALDGVSTPACCSCESASRTPCKGWRCRCSKTPQPRPNYIERTPPSITCARALVGVSPRRPRRRVGIDGRNDAALVCCSPGIFLSRIKKKAR